MAKTKGQSTPSNRYNTRSNTRSATSHNAGRNTGKAKTTSKTKLKPKDSLASLRKELVVLRSQNMALKKLTKDHEDRLIILVKDLATVHRFSTHALRALTGVHLCNFDENHVKNTLHSIKACRLRIETGVPPAPAPVIPTVAPPASKPPQNGEKELPMSPEVAMMYI